MDMLYEIKQVGTNEHFRLFPDSSFQDSDTNLIFTLGNQIGPLKAPFSCQIQC